MCFSDSSANSHQIKQTFHKIKEQRKNYQKQTELSKATICMLEYMEHQISNKIGWTDEDSDGLFSFLFCCRNNKQHNVRKEFRNAFQECNSREQFEYYRKFVTYMTGKQFYLPNPKPKYELSMGEPTQDTIGKQICFQGRVKGKVSWSKTITMKLIPQRYCLKIKQSQHNQERINLRNYIFRESNLPKSNAYVFSCTAPTEPDKVRITISKNNQNTKDIVAKIQQICDNALKENVLGWRQPVNHISFEKSIKQVRQPLAAIHNQRKSKKVKQQQIPQIKITDKSINNPLKNLIVNKAKYGIMKQIQDYNESLIDPHSKRTTAQKLKAEANSKGSNENEIPPLNKSKQNGNNFPTFKNISEKQSEKQGSEKFVNLFKSPSRQDAFKKKPAVAMSNQQIIFNHPQKIAHKKSQVINYAEAPSHTRSETGSIKMKGEGNQFDVQTKHKSSQENQQNSGKSSRILDDVCFQIDEEEQFGNVSVISKDTDQSFKTIGDVYI